MKNLRLPLGPWGRGLVAALLLAGASAPGLSIPGDAVATVAVVVFSLGFPISLARATLPQTASFEERGSPALHLRARAPREQPPRAPSPPRRHQPPAFLRHQALLR